MTAIRIEMDRDLIARAAAQAGIDATMPPGDQARAIMRKLAGEHGRDRTKTGADLKRAGREWEKNILVPARAAGFPAWDVGPLRGRRDLLDLTGTLPDRVLVGAKSVQRGVPMTNKLWAAMDQCHDAMENLPRSIDPAGILPLQVIQRPGADVRAAYAVTEWAWLLPRLAELRDLRAAQAR